MKLKVHITLSIYPFLGQSHQQALYLPLIQAQKTLANT